MRAIWKVALVVGGLLMAISRPALTAGIRHEEHEEFLFRVGVAYELPISDTCVVLSEFNANFVDEETRSW